MEKNITGAQEVRTQNEKKIFKTLSDACLQGLRTLKKKC
jgi:hypothetical protein